ncbi:hypothetical protein Lser_V15G38261 [Lactuca serriola]
MKFVNPNRLLRCFYTASGLKVNLNKSKVFGIGVQEIEVSRLANILCCEPGKFPFTYLGLPIGANMKLAKHWRPIVDKFKNKLSNWKANNLSFGGRLTLVKSVLGFNLEDLFVRRLRAGNRTYFWKDKWCDGVVLKDVFPELYRIEVQKNCMVNNRIQNKGLDGIHGQWSGNLRRGREATSLSYLNKKVVGMVLTCIDDSWVWKGNETGGFIVQNLRNLMATAEEDPIRGVTLPSCLCPLCGIEQEDVEHLFFKCSFAKKFPPNFNSAIKYTHPSVNSLHTRTSYVVHLQIMAPTGEQHLLSTEIVNRGIESSGPDAGSMSFSVRVRRRLPDFLHSVKLKYVKLGYHYLINHGIYLATVPVLALVFGAEVGRFIREEMWRKLWDTTAGYDLVSLLLFVAVFTFTLSYYFLFSPRSICLVDFACFKPDDDLKVTKDEFIELARKSGKFDEESLEFQKKILESSGIGDETYVPKAISSPEKISTMKDGRAEASLVIFGALDELFEKTGIQPKDVGVLVVNCSIFNPTPSLSAMIINHYKMRGNTLSFNLGGMGCSAGIIAVDLATDMLQANTNNVAVVVSTEIVSYNWYPGRDRSMLIPNCFFRMGCSALMLSNRRGDYRRAKYRLEHIVRTHKGGNDSSFRSVYQEEDEQRFKGLKISKDIVEIGGDAIKTNITTLGPLVLPVSEQLLFFSTLIKRYLSGTTKDKEGVTTASNSSQLFPPPSSSSSATTTKPYIPDYKLAFEHFCIHVTSKTVLNELQRNLGLSDNNMEPSRATLHRFGNTSSSSIWYELAYLEAKGRVKRGDRVWQLAFGSGFKCNSAVWKSVRDMKKPSANNPWLDCIDRYPGEVLSQSNQVHPLNFS